MQTRTFSTLALTIVLGCGDAPTDIEARGCDVANVVFDVRTEPSVVLDWTPRCPVALLFVEPYGEPDAWQIRSASWDDRAEVASVGWNTIMPPVLYGVTPPGAAAVDYDPPRPLTTGPHYLGIMRVLESGLVANHVAFQIR